MKVVLELQDQPSNVRRITVRHDIVIGRGSDCNLRLSAPQVSRRHCFLRVGRDSVSVTDLDSSNGTFIDGVLITAGKRCEVADGAQLALGPIRFIIHLRAETLSADNAKSKVAAGVCDQTPSVETVRESHPCRATSRDGSTVGGRSRIEDSDVPMDYNMEQGGDSAEPHESTAELLDHPRLTAALADLISPAPDPMDSRLEIIDFGRRLSKEGVGGDESCAIPLHDVLGKSEADNDEEPQWESAIVDSSDAADDLDVLSIVDGSDMEGGGELDDSGPLNMDSVDTICPQPSAGAAVPGHTFVVVDEVLDVSNDDEMAIEPEQSAEDAMDPGLRNFLKGFD